jgi:hypothetical protein
MVVVEMLFFFGVVGMSCVVLDAGMEAESLLCMVMCKNVGKQELYISRWVLNAYEP